MFYEVVGLYQKRRGARAAEMISMVVIDTQLGSALVRLLERDDVNLVEVRTATDVDFRKYLREQKK